MKATKNSAQHMYICQYFILYAFDLCHCCVCYWITVCFLFLYCVWICCS